MTPVETIRRVLNTLVSDGDSCSDEVRDAFAALTALQADAERYRWLRESRGYGPRVISNEGWVLIFSEVDAAIDALKAKE